MNPQTYDQLREDLERHEGIRFIARRDNSGNIVVGIGHRGSDVREGQVVNADRIWELFSQDTLEAVRCCEYLVPRWNGHPEEVKCLVAHIAFLLGNRLAQQRVLLAALQENDYRKAARKIRASDWYRALPQGRGEEIVYRMHLAAATYYGGQA